MMKANSSLAKLTVHNFKLLLKSFLTRGTVGSNSLLAFASLAMQFFANVVLLIVLARLVDVGTLGEILYAIVFSNIVIVLASYGFDNLVIREVSQGRYGIVQITSNLLLAKLALSAGLLLITWLFVQVVPVPLRHPADLGFYVGAALVNSFINSLNALRKGKNDFVTETKVSLFRSSLFFVSVVVAVYFWNATTALVGQIRLFSRGISLAFAAGIFVRALWKEGDHLAHSWKPRPTIMRELFVVGFPFALQAILGTAYFQLGTLVLGALKTSTEVGYYQAAMQIVSGVMLVPTAVIQAYYPKLAREFLEPESASMSLMKQMMGILAIIGLGLTVLFGLGAPILIPLLYGAKMQPSIAVMQILSLVFLIRSVASGLGISLISIGLQKVLALAGFVAVVGSLGLNLLLVPRGSFVVTAWINLLVNLTILSIYGSVVETGVSQVYRRMIGLVRNGGKQLPPIRLCSSQALPATRGLESLLSVDAFLKIANRG